MRCGAAAAVAVAATTQSPLLPPYLPAMAASGLCLPHVAAAWLAARRGAWERNSGCGTLLLFAAGVACGTGGKVLLFSINPLLPGALLAGNVAVVA